LALFSPPMQTAFSLCVYVGAHFREAHYLMGDIFCVSLLLLESAERAAQGKGKGSILN
jgi:hypothetical protein